MVFGGAPRAFFGSSGPSGLMGIVCGMCPTCPTKSCLWVAFGFAEINIYIYIYMLPLVLKGIYHYWKYVCFCFSQGS